MKRTVSLESRVAGVARAVAALAAWLVVWSPANAIVSSTAPSNWVVGNDSRVAAEAELVINGHTGCSGSLLAGGAFVLTAAHCVTGTNSGAVTATTIHMTFKGGATSTVTGSGRVSVFSTWAGAQSDGRGLGFNNDLALLRLDTPVAAIGGYRVYGLDPLGATVVLTGYGYSGTGTTGYQSGTFGVLHWGENEYDAMYRYGGSYLFDFDNGTSQRNALARLGEASSTGLMVITPPGASPEAMIAPGDSGGASFAVGTGGEFYLAGVHSFLARVDNGSDLTKSLDGSYGEIGGDTVLFTRANADWIRSVTGRADVVMVPEPATYAMLFAGAAVLAGAHRRRSRSTGRLRR